MRGNIYVLFGAGGNITLSVGPDGVLMVDSGTTDKAGAVLNAIQQLQRQLDADGRSAAARVGCRDALVGGDRARSASRRRSRFATSSTRTRIADHVGGNEKLAAAGRTFTGGNVAGDIRDAAEGAAVIAHENVESSDAHAAGWQGLPAPIAAAAD